MKFISKPSIVEANQWLGDTVSYEAIEADVGGDKLMLDSAEIDGEDYTALLLLAGKDGVQKWVPVPVRHWVVHQPDDLTDIWPIDDEYFQAKYEAAP